VVYYYSWDKILLQFYRNSINLLWMQSSCGYWISRQFGQGYFSKFLVYNSVFQDNSWLLRPMSAHTIEEKLQLGKQAKTEKWQAKFHWRLGTSWVPLRITLQLFQETVNCLQGSSVTENICFPLYIATVSGGCWLKGVPLQNICFPL
jgi:hypothetical protein